MLSLLAVRLIRSRTQKNGKTALRFTPVEYFPLSVQSSRQSSQDCKQISRLLWTFFLIVFCFWHAAFHQVKSGSVSTIAVLPVTKHTAAYAAEKNRPMKYTSFNTHHCGAFIHLPAYSPSSLDSPYRYRTTAPSASLPSDTCLCVRLFVCLFVCLFVVFTDYSTSTKCMTWFHQRNDQIQ